MHNRGNSSRALSTYHIGPCPWLAAERLPNRLHATNGDKHMRRMFSLLRVKVHMASAPARTPNARLSGTGAQTDTNEPDRAEAAEARANARHCPDARVPGTVWAPALRSP